MRPTLREPVFLRGPRISLRPLTAEDAEGAYPGWLNDAHVCQGNSHHTRPYPRAQARAYIEQSRRPGADSVVLAITLNTDQRHIGNIALTHLHPIHRTAEFSILLGDATQWGKGFGVEAARLLIAHGFSALNLRRIHCGTFATNGGFRKLAAHLGMKEEGRRRRAVYKSGRYLDVIEYGLFRNEFIAADKS